MRLKLCFSFLTMFIIYSHLSFVYAQSNVGLNASVGRYYFSASGIVSPFASVVMTSQNTFLGSSVADSQGKFAIPKILVNDGFNSFCLEASDIRRIGTSYTCFNTEPPVRDFNDNDIFLPPTVGLSGRKITPDSSITSSGYSMPDSFVTVNLGNNLWIDTKTDKNGYYKAEIKKIPVGSYELYAAAVYQDKISHKPSRTFRIQSLPQISSIPNNLLLLFLILPLILIIILLIILWKRRGKRSGVKKSTHFPRFFSGRA